MISGHEFRCWVRGKSRACVGCWLGSSTEQSHTEHHYSSPDRFTADRFHPSKEKKSSVPKGLSISDISRHAPSDSSGQRVGSLLAWLEEFRQLLLPAAFLKALEHRTCGECYLQNTDQECVCGEFNFKYTNGYSNEECSTHAHGGTDQTEWAYCSKLAGCKLDIVRSSPRSKDSEALEQLTCKGCLESLAWRQGNNSNPSCHSRRDELGELLRVFPDLQVFTFHRQ